MKLTELMATSSLSLKELAKKLKVEFSGNGDLQITHVCGLDSLQRGGLAYLTRVAPEFTYLAQPSAAQTHRILEHNYQPNFCFVPSRLWHTPFFPPTVQERDGTRP